MLFRSLGGASSASNLVPVTVPAPAPLRPPSSLMLTVLSKTEIELEWADNNPRADNRTLVIERKEPNGEFKPHLEIPLLANTGTDLFGEVPRNRLRSRTYRNIDNVQVEEGGKYSYRIKLKDTYGLGLGALSFESDYSLSETVKVDPLFLSRKVICDWFLGNQRNIAFDGW